MNFDELKKSVVMVVVDGPDPKDKILKERPFFTYQNSLLKKISCSGVVIDKNKKLILTNGSIFSNFMNEKTHQVSLECNITIVIDPKTKFNAKLIKIFKSVAANKWISQITLGSCDWFWGWNSDFEKQVLTTPSCLALLEIERDLSGFKELNEQGEDIYVISSPFGILSPTSFQNSISKGIVSNILGVSKNHIIMTDARMLPGSEGGGIFNKNGELIGLCTIPLKRSDTTVEINFGICSDVILDELKDVLNKSRKESNGIDEILNLAIKSLVQIHVSYSWASGIVISSDGYILTNAHLFEPHIIDGHLEKGTFISVQFDSDLTKYHEASLIYCSKGPLDLAIIKVNLNQLEPVQLINPPRYEEGQKVFVIGYPLFTPESKVQSTITTGIISKICRVGGIPTMIQTSAQVHKGNSGGLLVNSKGEFLGIITSNLKHNINTGTENEQSVLIPSMNFVIPVERLSKIDQALKNNMNLLFEYDKYNKSIEDLWEFREPSEKPSKFLEFMDQIQKGGKISKL